MKQIFIGLLVAAECLFLFSFTKHQRTGEYYIPKGWKKPSYDFSKNKFNPAKVELGRQLFYDPVLSADSTISCNSCHSQYMAFAHTDHDLSHGIDGKIGVRNAPSLVNLAWSKTFMWDGAINHLDVQALAPMSNPVEMNENIQHVVVKLQHTKHYPVLFYQAFGDSTITGEHLLKAISQFMLILVSDHSKYDKVKRGEEKFTKEENAGYSLFTKHCNSCHQEPLFTNDSFENNGLIPDKQLKDIGRMKVTGRREDSLKFKVPTLRNIAITAPYMHDGRFKNLNQVLNHYIMGIHHSPTLNPQLQKGVYLSTEDKYNLTAFLMTLTDKQFLYDERFSFLKKQ